MALKELLERVTKGGGQREQLIEERLRESFVNKVDQIWQKLPSHHSYFYVHHCELRDINWERIDRRFTLYLPLDQIRKEVMDWVTVRCSSWPESKSAKLDLAIGGFRPPFKLSFSVFDRERFYAQLINDYSLRSLRPRYPSILHGAEIAKAAGFEPSLKRVLELANMSAGVVEDALSGKLKCQVIGLK